jgi:hypothetical protein
VDYPVAVQHVCRDPHRRNRVPGAHLGELDPERPCDLVAGEQLGGDQLTGIGRGCRVLVGSVRRGTRRQVVRTRRQGACS